MQIYILIRSLLIVYSQILQKKNTPLGSMENLYKRVGYFLREVTTPDGKPTMFFRYFIIDNDQNLHTTAHYSHI